MSSLRKRRLTLAIKILEHVITLENKNRKKRRRRYWCKPKLPKTESSSYVGPTMAIRENNPDDFRTYLQMSEASFRNLLMAVKLLIEKKNTLMRDSIPAEQRLAATLLFLATGRSLQHLMSTAAISVPALSSIIPVTCEAIVGALREEYFKFPKNPQEWNKVADEFERLWQLPNCGGVLDGKHVRIARPANSGAYYNNYKGYCSIILTTLVNANYEFLMVDVGRNGQISDGEFLEQTQFINLLQNDELQLPANEDTQQNLHFVFIGDEAFPLHKHLLKPFPETPLTEERKIFNYHLSRARCAADNAFALMANRFRIFQTAINLLPEKIEKVVLASCALHNYLLRHDTQAYCPPSMMDMDNVNSHDMISDEWRIEAEGIASLEPGYVHPVCDEAIRSREQYAEYFNGAGAV
ncbi:hypothetical protein PRIEUP_LOCUS1200, partial [Pristimantis euphronides]